MSGTGNAINIATIDARDAARGQTTLEGRVRAAMAVTFDHYLLGTDADRLRAAVAGAYLAVEDPGEQATLIASYQAARRYENDDRAPLLTWWGEAGRR